MATWYSDEDTRKLGDERVSLLRRRLLIQERFLQHHFKSEEAKNFGVYGFSRRLSTLVRCIENTFSVIPPEFYGVPTLEQTHDVMIHVQAFIFNVFGCLDNLAWVWVKEENITKADGQPLPRTRVGLQPDNRFVRNSLRQELRDLLQGMTDWFAYLEDVRHALAHQIPLYVPPFSVDPKNEKRYNDLEQSILKLSLERKNSEALERERDSLMFFRHVIVS